MKSLAVFSKNLFTKFCQQGVADRANFLKNTAVIGWVLSSLAQVCAITFNDKIPSKEKKFLIPQEIFDGIINATLFWFVTSKATDFGKRLVLNKFVLPETLKNVMKDFVPKGNNISSLKEAFLSHVKVFGNAENLSTAKNTIEGMGVLTGIVGAILSNNIATPLIRNKLAGMYQKTEIKKANDNAPLNPYFGNLDFSKYNFAKLSTAPKTNTFKGFYNNSSLKI